MKSKMIPLVFLISIAFLFTITWLVTSASDQKEKATPIQVGEMSEQQRQHSKIWGKYHTGRKLDAPPSRTFRGEVEQGVYIEPGTPVINPDAPPVSFEDFIAQLNCNADAIVVVKIKEKASQLTENKEFIFTDYTAEIEEIDKNNQVDPIQQRSLITITYPGGTVEIKGKAISALDASFKLLQPEQRYLLFLKFIPQTGAYQSIRQGSFLIKDNTVVAMTEELLPGGPGNTREITSNVRSALQTNCQK